MGFVWAVRRSLRLLTLLTLMASALCAGQSLAAQEIAPPRATLADSIALADSVSFTDSAALLTADVFESESAVSLASAISATGTTSGPAFAYTAGLSDAPAATAPLLVHFSPRAERAPPAA